MVPPRAAPLTPTPLTIPTLFITHLFYWTQFAENVPASTRRRLDGPRPIYILIMLLPCVVSVRRPPGMSCLSSSRWIFESDTTWTASPATLPAAVVTVISSLYGLVFQRRLTYSSAYGFKIVIANRMGVDRYGKITLEGSVTIKIVRYVEGNKTTDII